MSPPDWTAELQDQYNTLYAYSLVAGRSVHDCAIIAQRFRVSGFRWDQSESWVVRISPPEHPDHPDTKRLVVGGRDWMTRVWMSPEGHTWVSTMNGYVVEETGPGTYRTHKLDVPLSGVWGLSDRCVYAWSEVKEQLYRFDGASFREIPSPGRMIAMAGVGPDALLATGYHGVVWRWDGQAWSVVPIALTGNVTGICAPSADRAYACSTEGDIAEITPFGAQVMARWEGPLLDVTRLGDELLLAAGRAGVLKLALGTNVIEEASSDFVAERFDNQGGVVLIAADEGVVQTTDAKTFDLTTSAEFLWEQRRRHRPLWRR